MEEKALVEPVILAFALRYSIGRKTYAPSLVIEEIKENINIINSSTIDVMISDVRGHIGSYGDESDKANWESFADYLELIVKGR